MSAFFMDKADIDLIVSGAYELRVAGVSGFNPDDLGKMLWGTNLKSLQSRYPSSWQETASERDVESYVFREYCDINHAALVKLVHCFAYQSCEHDGWEGSEAQQLCQDIEHVVVRRMRGYESAPWGTGGKGTEIARVCNARAWK